MQKLYLRFNYDSEVTAALNYAFKPFMSITHLLWRAFYYSNCYCCRHRHLQQAKACILYRMKIFPFKDFQFITAVIYDDYLQSSFFLYNRKNNSFKGIDLQLIHSKTHFYVCEMLACKSIKRGFLCDGKTMIYFYA